MRVVEVSEHRPIVGYEMDLTICGCCTIEERRDDDGLVGLRRDADDADRSDTFESEALSPRLVGDGCTAKYCDCRATSPCCARPEDDLDRLGSDLNC